MKRKWIIGLACAFVIWVMAIIPIRVNAEPVESYAVYRKAGSGSSSYAKVSIPLGAPKTVAVSAAEGKVTVAWSKVDGAVKYGLFRRMNKGDAWSSWALISDSLTNSKYVDTAVASNTEYQYRVRAYSEAGWGGFKVSEKVKTPLTVPAAPETLKAIPYTGKVAVSWSKVEGATKYCLYRRDQQGGTWTSWKAVSTQTAASYADKNVASGSVYQYRVRAYNDAGWGSFVVSDTVKTKASVPAAPDTITAKAYTNKISVTWSKVSGATKYCLYRREYVGSSWSSWKAISTRTTTSYADQTVTAGTKYQYRVRAYNDAGWGGFVISDAIKAKGSEEPGDGAWSYPLATYLTEEQLSVFNRAVDNIVGVSYEAMASLGYRVVSGMDYRFLCKRTAILQKPVTNYVILTIHEDLDGNVQISSIMEDIETVVVSEKLDGSFVEPASIMLSSDDIVINNALKAFSAALENFVGVQYTPLAVLGSQSVAGTNYRLLCLGRPAVENAETFFCIVTVYEPLEGQPMITDISSFD